jgi:hypothetical protein
MEQMRAHLSGTDTAMATVAIFDRRRLVPFLPSFLPPFLCTTL